MDPDDERAPADGAAPEDAFALVADPIRAGVLRVLGEQPHAELSFSELRSRVDETVDSGQFNYHLRRLVGQFVERTDDGYTLRPEGRTLHRAIRAGTFTRRVSVDPFDAGFDCYFCAAPVEGRYGEGAFELRCSGCGHVYAHTRAPPSAVAGGGDDTASSPEAILDRIDRFTRHEVLAYAQRLCPICVGDLDVEFVPGETVWTDGSERLDVFVRYACDHCSNVQMTSVGLSLLHHPALVAFLHDHGVDVAATPHWEFEFAVTDRHVTVRSTDPWEVALSVTRDDETLELVVDGDLAVTRTTRS